MTAQPHPAAGEPRSSDGLGRGFADPVLSSQRVFRTLLGAMSAPGTAAHLADDVEPAPGLHASTARLLLTLADAETPVWLAPSLGPAAPSWVRFHTGAPVVDVPATAAIAVLDGAATAPLIDAFHAGDDRYPDRSATLLVQCAALGGGEPVGLAGPGIAEPLAIRPTGLRVGFWREAAANHARYPLGVDLVLVAGDAIVALPRSTRPTEAG
jgi:alpha-D-ribose 1-methylphosphonate 5-triphosphate synthase subunit PhnH